MKTEEEMIAERDALNAELYSIHKTRRQVQNEMLLGKCFKYPNSLGGDKPMFWLYSIVTGAGEHFAKVLSFQERTDGIIEIKPFDWHSESDGNIEISREEFDEAWNALIARITSFAPA